MAKVNVKYIAISMGYVESGQVGHVIFRRQYLHPTSRLEAFKDLAKALFEQYLEQSRYKEKPFLFTPCCKEASTKGNYFCPGCGKDLREGKMDFSKYEKYLWKLPIQTADESGEELDGWWQWVSIFEVLKDCKPKNLVEITSQGEKFLIGVLDPMLMTPDIKAAWDEWIKENWDLAYMKESLDRIDSGQDVLV